MKLSIMMQKGLFASLCILIVTTASADQKKSHEEGKAFAKQYADKNRQAVKAFKLEDVPGFKTASPQEAGMSVTQLDAQKETILTTNENAKFLSKTLNEKPCVKIDPVNDPSFKRANDAAANPIHIIFRGRAIFY